MASGSSMCYFIRNRDPRTSSRTPYRVWIVPNPPLSRERLEELIKMNDDTLDSSSSGSDQSASSPGSPSLPTLPGPGHGADEKLASPLNTSPYSEASAEKKDQASTQTALQPIPLNLRRSAPTLSTTPESRYHSPTIGESSTSTLVGRLYDAAGTPLPRGYAGTVPGSAFGALNFTPDTPSTRWSNHSGLFGSDQPSPYLTATPRPSRLEELMSRAHQFQTPDTSSFGHRPFLPNPARQALDRQRLDQEAQQARVFQPMQTTLSNLHLSPAAPPRPKLTVFPPQPEAWQRMIAGFSPNYKGNINLPRNRSADIPAELNCSLFILGLPPNATTQSLLGTIRDTGRVFATHINAPEPEKGHMTCAAKIIFFERAGAERFYDQCVFSGLTIPGQPGFVARVVWNRIRTGPNNGPRHHTRVLQIAGPHNIVNQGFLTSYFKSKLEFEIDEIIDRGGNGERHLLEYRFGSFRCQAEAAKMAIVRELAEYGVQVWFGPDPCDVVATESTDAGGWESSPLGAGGSIGFHQSQPSRAMSSNWRNPSNGGN